MSVADYKFNLRSMQPSDSKAVANLVTEFDGDLTTRFRLDAYTAIISGTDNPTLGVVVDALDMMALWEWERYDSTTCNTTEKSCHMHF